MPKDSKPQNIPTTSVPSKRTVFSQDIATGMKPYDKPKNIPPKKK